MTSRAWSTCDVSRVAGGRDRPAQAGHSHDPAGMDGARLQHRRRGTEPARVGVLGRTTSTGLPRTAARRPDRWAAKDHPARSRTDLTHRRRPGRSGRGRRSRPVGPPRSRATGARVLGEAAVVGGWAGTASLGLPCQGEPRGDGRAAPTCGRRRRAGGRLRRRPCSPPPPAAPTTLESCLDEQRARGQRQHAGRDSSYGLRRWGHDVDAGSTTSRLLAAARPRVSPPVCTGARPIRFPR
jgi:hypothetical protein